jgi:hypothetical protein
MPVYKGGDGRRSGAMTISEGEVEESRLLALGAACVRTGLGSRGVASDGIGSDMGVYKSWKSKR